MPMVPNIPVYKERLSQEIHANDELDAKQSDKDSIARGQGDISKLLKDDSGPSEESLSTNIFADPEVCAHYVALYEKAKYEGRHVFDATLTWTISEEKTLLRKIDWNACLWACIMFFGLQVDRGNLAQAASDNFLDDLKLNTNDYNLGNTVFKIAFLCAELPSQLISKKIGPDRWVPLQITLWSVVAMSQCALSGRSSFLATRVLLGLLEGGFIPDMVLWLSYFYTSEELPFRLSIFWTTLNVSGIVTSLLAFAILHLRGFHGWAGWRWLFLLEGLVTLAIGLASFFMMPASAVQTKSWLRPKGWFTDREAAISVNRVLRDDPTKGDMHNRKALTPKAIFRAVMDYDLWPIYLLGLLCFVPTGTPSTYITLILKQLGFSTFSTNLLTIPSTAAGCFTLLGLTYFSEWINERTFVASFQAIWVLPFLIALRFWPGALVDAWSTYAIIAILLAYPYCHAILVGLASTNSGSVRTRTVSASIYNISVQIGNIIAANIYRADDAPLYHRGNTSLIAIDVAVLFLFALMKLFYVVKNRGRKRKWDAMSVEARAEYLKSTKDSGNKRLDFRFAH